MADKVLPDFMLFLLCSGAIHPSGFKSRGNCVPSPNNVQWRGEKGKPESFVKATQRLWHTPQNASFIELPVIAGNAR